MAASIQVKVLDRVADEMIGTQSAEHSFEVAEAVDHGWLVGWPTGGAADESRNGRSDSRDGPDATRDFLDVNAWISRCDGH